MLRNLLALAVLPLLALAEPIPVPGPSTTTLLPEPLTSVGASTIGYTYYFASPNCEFTSNSGTITPNECVTIAGDGVTQSFKLDPFFRGNDYACSQACHLEQFAGTSCTGTPESIIRARNVDTACEAVCGPVSYLLVC